MDCDKCLKKCKAECCSVVPFDTEILKKHKPIRNIIERIEFDDLVILETIDNVCPFLGFDFKCSIYNDRPEVCKKFGNEEHFLMTCAYINKDNEVRSRQERRKIQRKQKKHQDGFINNYIK